MRKLVANFFLSVDGVMEAPDKWQFPYFTDEMGEAITASFASSDALLMGRVNYQEGAAYWPTSNDLPIADVMNNIRKGLELVNSKTYCTGVVDLTYRPVDG